ncbi:hypothetical protein LY76DRAFT_335032 [Colletotrichum caudatum]|nr:hypothetical protein LY76DRAFT_335032 [Colletotrichum caudatum]
MAASNVCTHDFRMVKSESTLIQWTCNMCHSGPYWAILEWRYCKLHTCQTCTRAA